MRFTARLIVPLAVMAFSSLGTAQEATLLEPDGTYALYKDEEVLFGRVEMTVTPGAGDYTTEEYGVPPAGFPETGSKSLTGVDGGLGPEYEVGEQANPNEITFYNDGTWIMRDSGGTELSNGTYVEYHG